MRERLIRAPWWAQALVAGSLFGALQVGMRLVQGGAFGRTIESTAVGAVFFGLAFGIWSARSNGRYLAARGDLTSTQRTALKHTMRRGPAPTDPQVREAAVRVIDLRVRQQRHLLWWAVPVYVVLIGMSVSLAVAENPAWLVLGAGFAAFLGWTVIVRRRMQERQRVLTA